jgi:hypothetical protein
MDCLRRCQHLIEALIYQSRDFERVEGGLFNADRNAPQASGRLIRQEILRQNPVEVQNRLAVEADFIRRAHKKRSCRCCWKGSIGGSRSEGGNHKQQDKLIGFLSLIFR